MFVIQLASGSLTEHFHMKQFLREFSKKTGNAVVIRVPWSTGDYSLSPSKQILKKKKTDEMYLIKQ